MWVDTHCHLYMSAEEPARLLDRAADVGVDWVMCPGVDLETSLEAAAVAAENPERVLWSVGLHPHRADRWSDEGARIEALATQADALGECGLDFYRNLSPRDTQLTAFREQLALAKAVAKPVIIHTRDAFADVYEILGDADLGSQAVLHCWTAGPKWTKRFRELGATFSFAGPLTYEKGETVRFGAAEAPPESTMVETDTPYLTPPPDRSSANEPANVVRVGEVLASVWGISTEEAAKLTSATAQRVFGKPSQ
jgi:TatD DNase family protein